MKFGRVRISVICLTAAAMNAALSSLAQAQLPPVYINEIVEDEQDFETTDIVDTREFVELYNAGATSINVSGWILNSIVIDTAATISDTLPEGSVIPAGGYFVIGQAGVPNVNYTPTSGELWNNGKTIYELRNPNLAGPTTLVDALAVDTFRTSEADLLTQEQIDQTGAGQTAGVGARAGWWGQLESNNAHPSDPSYPNLPMSLGRYRDGRDRNRNGYDFGMLPATPGATNNLPLVASHQITDVNPLAVDTVLHGDYYGSFKLPRVIAPGTATVYNPSTIPASPQGGNALIAWDETGGGNAVFSDELTSKFELWAYIDPTPFNVTTADTNQSEASIYGIGTTDPLFGTPNSGDLLTGQPGTGGNITSSANGSTGLGWLIQRRTSNVAGTQNSQAILQLLDMNDGGDGVLADNDWQVEASIDLTGMAAGWHRLSIDYNATTGAVVAKYDDQTFNFTSDTNLLGNFYVGYREQLPGTGGTIARPPTYDLYNAVVAQNADFNDDNIVDGADLLIWQRNSGGAGGLPQGDADANGQINAADLTIWKAQYGTSPAAIVAAAVPEPGCCLLMGVALLGAPLLARRSRSSALSDR